MEKHRNHSIRFFDYETGFRKIVIIDTTDAVITKPQSLFFFNIVNIRLNAIFNDNVKEPFCILSFNNQSALGEHALMIGAGWWK